MFPKILARFPFPAFTGNQETWPILATSEATMFNRKRANDILKKVSAEENALPVEKVLAALRREGQGRRTAVVLEAIKRFEEGLEDDAFPAGTPNQADSTGAGAAQVPPKPKSARRRKAGTTDTETKKPNSGNELARLKREAAETADRLKLLENRVLSLENDDLGFLVRMQDARRRQEEALWQRVMMTVSEIMQSHERLTLYDVLEMLPAEIVQEAIRIRIRLNYETLSRKMAKPMPSEEELRETDWDED